MPLSNVPILRRNRTDDVTDGFRSYESIGSDLS